VALNVHLGILYIGVRYCSRLDQSRVRVLSLKFFDYLYFCIALCKRLPVIMRRDTFDMTNHLIDATLNEYIT